MNYLETIQWMFAQLPMYQNQGASAYRNDLINIKLLAAHLGNPEVGLKCIHVAGTNGKGSTSHMLASILQESGYRVGLYTSPHLRDYRERIKINGLEIEENYVVSFIKKNKAFLEKNNLSFFEMTVGLAFDYFKKQKVDYAIIEVGMGGRLDATNIITPLISVITNIGLDHTQFLGDTLEAIANEKAGIIKTKVPVVVGEYTETTKKVFETKAKDNQAPISFAADSMKQIFESDLKGKYQQYNIKTVMQTIAVLNETYQMNLSTANIKKGLKNTIPNTRLMGRWQELQQNPRVVCDTAHNIEGLQMVVAQIMEQKFEQLHIVFGMVKDKNIDDVLQLLPKDAIYYFAKPNNQRAIAAEDIDVRAKAIGLNSNVYYSVSNAYQEALKNATAQDFIYIGGSNFVVAEVV
jgi:dihydrofolate synthase / folylpolyglutamate synthase